MPRPPNPGRLIARLLDEAASPVFVLDARRQIIFANQALAQWIGVEPEKLIGRQCDYRAVSGEDELTAVCAALCPPPEAFTGQASDGSVSRLAAGDGSAAGFERRAARFVQIAGITAGDGLLLVIVGPLKSEKVGEAGSLSHERLHSLLVKLRSQLGQRFAISQLIGESEPLTRVRQQVGIAAEARARVLVVGPPGSGREHVARTIHYGQSSGSIGTLVPIACPLVDAEQMQAQLAAVLRRQHDWPSDSALGGPAALLLDVDRLGEGAQQELAGFLHLPNIELQTIATSRISLQRLATKGRFRRDLAYELSTLTIELPRLARRREDIPLLAQHFLEEAGSTRPPSAQQLAGFQPAALELLAGLPWPGNIDELARAVREACERASGPHVSLADLPDWVHLAAGAAARPPRDEQPIQLDQFLADIEKELLWRALAKARGNKSKAAKLLGTSRQRLLRRLAQLGLIAPAAAEEPIIFEPLPEDS
jgi:transcriptional regulator with PAS, ATPase and Fis domain